MTAFDTTTYPLETSTRFKPSLGTKLDRLTDKSLRLRVLTTLRPMTIRCVFSPLSESSSEAFLQYLYTNAVTELDITHNGVTYRGYIDGDSLDCGASDGVLLWWSFDFEASAV